MSKDIDRTLWAGNLSDKVTDSILYELFLQAGPLEKVSIAKDRDGRLKGFAFITFTHEVSVPYTIQLMDGTPLYGKPIRLQSRPGSIHQQAQQQQQQIDNLRNPYQNMSPTASRPYPNMHQSSVPTNPYSHNQPPRPPQHTGMTPPFHKSHTWHGNDLSNAFQSSPQGQQQHHHQQQQQHDHDRESRSHRDDRGRHSRDRDSHRNRYSHHHDRDRSNSRHRQERIEDSRNSPNSPSYGGNSENFEDRRQKVLDKHNRMLQGHKHSSSKHGGYDRRGRF